MNNDFATVITLMTFYFLLLLLGLWWATSSIRLHINQAINLIRQHRTEDLHRHHERLLSAIRSQSVGRR